MNYNDRYRSNPPLLSIRSLNYDSNKENKLFQVAVPGQGQTSQAGGPTGTGLFSDQEKYDTRRIYKYSFSTEGDDGFVYFIFHQFNITGSKQVLKVE